MAALVPRLRLAADVAGAALDAFEAHIRDVVLPASAGEGRIGRELFARKLLHTFRTDEATIDASRTALAKTIAFIDATIGSGKSVQH